MKVKLLIIFLMCCIKSYSQEKDLRFYMEKAQANSPFLKDLSNQIKSNVIDSLLNKANYKPQISGNLNANYAPIINGYGYDSAITNGQTVSGLIGVNQKIVGKGIVNSQAETFKLMKDGLILNKNIALKDVNKVVISQYITSSGSLDQLEYNQKMAVLLKNGTGILKKLTQNSIYKQTDYLLFLSTLKQQEFQVLQLRQQYQNNLSLLNYLSGETDTAFVKLKKPEIVLKSIQKEDKIVFLKQFEVDSLKIKNQNIY